jgi:flagellar motor switch protein FliN
VPVLQAPRSPQPPPTPAPAAANPSGGEVGRILQLQVPVIVRLAERRILLSEVMRLGTGAIIEFSKRHDEPLELLVNNKPIAVGETVKVGENFGLRISQIGDVKQIIQALGAARP